MPTNTRPRRSKPIWISPAKLLADFPCQATVGASIDLATRPPDLLIAMHQPCDPTPEVLAEMTSIVSSGGTVMIAARNLMVLDRVRTLVIAGTRPAEGRA